MKEKTTLNQLEKGEKAKIASLLLTGSMRRRLLDIGFIENTVVECVGHSPSKDPSAYLVRGAVIALREVDSKKILIIPFVEGGKEPYEPC